MYFDLGKSLQTDGQFRHRYLELVEQYEQSERTGQPERSKQVFIDLCKLCHYNFGFLVPYYFPRYPDSKPLNLSARPFSYALFDFGVGTYTTIRASRQTGKSTSLGAEMIISSDILPKLRTLYIVPHAEHLKTFANRMREMERANRFYRPSPHFRQNLTYKEYPNGSIIEMARVLTDAGAIRGKTTDRLKYDEAQHFDPTLEPEIDQTIKVSKIKSRHYAGTSLTTDTFLEANWLESSQGTWVYPCGCGKTINFGIHSKDETILDIIKPQGPTCPKCSRLIQVSRGFYEHANLAALDNGRPGFHVPQLIIPDMVNDTIQWRDIYDAFMRYDLKKFLQEVLGIPTEEAERELTEQHLRDICVLTETPAQLQQMARKGFYKWVISGMDWGGSDYQPEHKTKLSYTVHAIIGVRHDFTFDIIHMRQYSGMAYDDIIGNIIHDHLQCGGNAIASDFGGGTLYNYKLRESSKVNPARHVVFGYTGPMSAPIATPAGPHMVNQFSLNKTESISSLYELIKTRRLRCYSWEHSARMLLQFLNLMRVPTENAQGAGGFKYRRHGSKADDALHAVNFATTFARILIEEPLIQDRGLRNYLQAFKMAAVGAGRGGKLVLVSG